jgi:hypothetical protein
VRLGEPIIVLLAKKLLETNEEEQWQKTIFTELNRLLNVLVPKARAESMATSAVFKALDLMILPQPS